MKTHTNLSIPTPEPEKKGKRSELVKIKAQINEIEHKM